MRGAPTNGMPARPERSMAGMDQRRSCHVDATSPVQCAVYAPEPTYVDLAASIGSGLGTSLTSRRARNPFRRAGMAPRRCSVPKRRQRLLHATQCSSNLTAKLA